MLSSFKRFRFFKNSVISAYDINDSIFKTISEYESDSIVPPTHDNITLERDLEHSYNAKLIEMQSTSKDSCQYATNIIYLAE